MAKDPAVLLYTSDFLIGVADMPFLDRGYYITLLCLQHQKGHLSEETICFSLGLSSVSEIPKVIEKFKVDEDGKYYQHRMEEESEKRAAYSESRRNNGSKGGRPPKEEPSSNKHMDNHMDSHMDSHMDNHMEDENDNENLDSNKDKKKGVKGEKKIECLTPLEETIGDFKAFRSKIKKPMTDRAVELLYINLDKLAGNDEQKKIAILNQSIMNGWQGVFELKENGKTGQDASFSYNNSFEEGKSL